MAEVGGDVASSSGIYVNCFYSKLTAVLKIKRVESVSPLFPKMHKRQLKIIVYLFSYILENRVG